MEIVQHNKWLQNMDWIQDVLPMDTAIDRFFDRRALWQERKQGESKETKRATGQKRPHVSEASTGEGKETKESKEAKERPVKKTRLTLTAPCTMLPNVEHPSTAVACPTCSIVYSTYFGHACLE